MHQNKKETDRKRYNLFNTQGYVVIAINSSDYLTNKEKTIEFIKTILNENNSQSRTVWSS